MTRTQHLRLVLLASGDVPPPLPASLARDAGAEWSARTLDGFLAELDAGGALPDAALALGGAALIRALRRHDRTCAWPIFLFGAAGTATPPGWDGAWTGEDLARVQARIERGAPLLALPAPSAPLDSARCEQRFARWLAARGEAGPADAEVFGLDAPRSLLHAWRERGWAAPLDDSGARWRAGPALADAWSPPTPPSSVSRFVPSSPPPDASTAVPIGAQVERRLAWLAGAALLAVFGFMTWKLGANAAQAPAPAPAAAANLRIGERVDPLPGAPAPAAVEISSGTAPARSRLSLPSALPAAGRGTALAVPAAVAPASAPTAPPPPERVVARGVVRREQVEWRSSAAGRVEAWLASPGDSVSGGAPLLLLDDPALGAEVARLEGELARVEEAIRAQSNDAADAAASAAREAEAEQERLTAAAERASARARDARSRYQHSLRLAQEGVLAYRDVRPDWDALLRAQEEEESAVRRLEAFQRESRATDARSAALPAWLAERRVELAEDLTAARQKVSSRALRAPQDADLLEFAVAPGAHVEEGALLARLGLGAPWLEVRLDASDRRGDAAVLEPELRLRHDAPWVPITDFEQARLPDGATLLRARLPADLRGAARSGLEAEIRFLLVPE